MESYILGLIGMWLFADGIVSIRLYWKENWWSCHSIRLIRVALAVTLIIIGGMGID